MNHVQLVQFIDREYIPSSIALMVGTFFTSFISDTKRPLHLHLERALAIGMLPTAAVMLACAFDPAIFLSVPGLNLPQALSALSVFWLSVMVVWPRTGKVGARKGRASARTFGLFGTFFGLITRGAWHGLPRDPSTMHAVANIILCCLISSVVWSLHVPGAGTGYDLIAPREMHTGTSNPG